MCCCQSFNSIFVFIPIKLSIIECGLKHVQWQRKFAGPKTLTTMTHEFTCFTSLGTNPCAPRLSIHSWTVNNGRHKIGRAQEFEIKRMDQVRSYAVYVTCLLSRPYLARLVLATSSQSSMLTNAIHTPYSQSVHH